MDEFNAVEKTKSVNNSAGYFRAMLKQFDLEKYNAKKMKTKKKKVLSEDEINEKYKASEKLVEEKIAFENKNDIPLTPEIQKYRNRILK